VTLRDTSVDTIIEMSGGYPYFIQFVCKEVYDAVIQKIDAGEAPNIPVAAIQRKLDSDFFAGRWARVTDRQRELLAVIASLENCDTEFTVQEVVEGSKSLETKGFSSSHANQMLAKLGRDGLVFKNRHGKYSFAVPLLGQFINRQMAVDQTGPA
ncbi:MAG: ATP-binding protein, partial [Vicinamibacterales bacterium]